MGDGRRARSGAKGDSEEARGEVVGIEEGKRGVITPPAARRAKVSSEEGAEAESRAPHGAWRP